MHIEIYCKSLKQSTRFGVVLILELYFLLLLLWLLLLELRLSRL